MSPFLGEFMGTLTVVLLGDGVVACVLLSQSKGQNSGWIVITAGWGFAVTAGVFVSGAFGSLDAHLNPAVTVWNAITTGDPGKLYYIPAQILGAMVGAALVWLAYLPHWRITDDQGAKLGVFCTAPAIRAPLANLLCEVIGSSVLLIGLGAIFSKVNPTLASGLGPLLVGILVWSIGLSLGGPTGYAINPARDFGPRLTHFLLPIAGKGTSDWGYAWIPILGPILGAILTGLFFRWLSVV